MQAKEFYCVSCYKVRSKEFMINKSGFGKHICIECDKKVNEPKKAVKKPQLYSDSKKLNNFIKMVTMYD